MNKKFFKKNFTVFIYVLIIFSSMLPNKTNSINLHELNSIIPGINKLYSSKQETNTQKQEYSFKLLEIIQNII